MQCLTLFGSIAHANFAQIHCACNRIRVDLLYLTQLLFHSIQINGDTACILVDQCIELRHQPWDVGEQAGMGFFNKRKVGQDFVIAELKFVSVSLNIFRNEGPGRIIEERDPLVEASADIARQPSACLPYLHCI